MGKMKCSICGEEFSDRSDMIAHISKECPGGIHTYLAAMEERIKAIEDKLT